MPGELKIVVNEVVVGAETMCSITGDPKYNIKVYELNTTNLVTEKTQPAILFWTFLLRI